MKRFLLFGILLLSSKLPAQNSWTKKADFPDSEGTEGAMCFSIGNKGYIAGGYYDNSLWEWNQSTNIWTERSYVGFVCYGVGYSIGNKGYVGTGLAAGVSLINSFIEWDQMSDSWHYDSIQPLPGQEREFASGFSIGTKLYIGLGTSSPTNHFKDFWEWDQTTDTWTQKSDFGGGFRYHAFAFSIGTKGFIGAGQDAPANLYKDFWEWDQSTNIWTQKSDFGGGFRYSAVGFSIANKGYAGVGYDNTFYPTSDFWEWDPALGTWTQLPDFSGTARHSAIGFSIGTKGYIGTGKDVVGNKLSDFWEFTPNLVSANENKSNNYDIIIAPNPTTSNVFVNSNCKITSIDIYSLSGDVLLSLIPANQFEMVDLTPCKAGSYIILIKIGESTVSRKILKL